MRTAAAIVLSAVLFACSSTSSGTGGAGSNRVALDATTLCNKLIDECKQTITQETCDRAFAVMRVTPECSTKLSASTCDELKTTFDGTDETCFPACTAPDTQSCNGDGTITSCSDAGRTLVLDCQATCEKASNPPKSFTGTCGLSHNGQQSSDGKEKCWCN